MTINSNMPLFLLFALVSNVYSQDTIRHYVQENAPSFYINWWCSGNVDQQDLALAVGAGRNRFAHAALAHCQNQQLEINTHELLQRAVQRNNAVAVDILLAASDTVSLKTRDGSSLINDIFLNHRYTPGERDALIKKIVYSGKVHEEYAYDDLKRIVESNASGAGPLLRRALIRRLDAHTIRADEAHDVSELRKIIALNPGENFTAHDLYSSIYNENTGAAKAILTLNPQLLNAPLNQAETSAFSLAVATNNRELADHVLAMGANHSALHEPHAPHVASLVAAYEQRRSERLSALAAVLHSYLEIRDRYQAFMSRALLFPFLHQHARPPAELALPETIIPEYDLEKIDSLALYALEDLYTAHGKALKTAQDYVRELSCPVCLEGYANMRPVILCNSKHAVCITCFNDPTMRKCPLCREALSFDKLSMCQTCAAPKKNLTFCYCNDCKTTGVLCLECSLLPCCKKPRPAQNHAGSREIEKHCKAYIQQESTLSTMDIEHIQREGVRTMNVALERFTTQKNDLVKQLIKIQQEAQPLSAEREELQRKIQVWQEKQRALFADFQLKRNLDPRMSAWQRTRYVGEESHLVSSMNALISRHNELHTLLVKLHDENAEIVHKIKTLAQSGQAEHIRIKKILDRTIDDRTKALAERKAYLESMARA